MDSMEKRQTAWLPVTLGDRPLLRQDGCASEHKVELIPNLPIKMYDPLSQLTHCCKTSHCKWRLLRNGSSQSTSWRSWDDSRRHRFLGMEGLANRKRQIQNHRKTYRTRDHGKARYPPKYCYTTIYICIHECLHPQRCPCAENILCWMSTLQTNTI